MRFVADENIPRDLIIYLRNLGYDVVSVVEQMQGATDREIFAYAKEDQRTIITLDTDFGNILRFPLMTHAGILLLRTKHEHPTALTEMLTRALLHLSPERILGRVIVVDPKRLRVYPKI